MLFPRRFIRKTKTFFHTLRGFGGAIYGGIKKLETDLENLRAKATEINQITRSTDQQILFSYVGRALTAWSKMEETMVAIIAVLLMVSVKKAGVVMYSIYNFNTWLAVTNDLFELDEVMRPFQKRFNKISERIRRIKDLRDQLAHHSVRMSDDKSTLQSPDADARSKSKKQLPLEYDEISDFTTDVLKIAEDLIALYWDMVAHAPSSRKYDVPAIGPSSQLDSQ